MSVCVRCKKSMVVLAIGVTLVQTVGKNRRPQSAIQADIEGCIECGCKIIARVADKATEHFQPEFQEIIDKAKKHETIYYVHEK